MSYESIGTLASLPRTMRGVPLVINGDPKGKNFLYCNGNAVIIRDIENPDFADVYTQHPVPTTVAKYSPSGFYIASADTSGKVRIWDTTQKEHILKNEFHPLGGAIKDLAWTGDSQRIVVVGNGREKCGHVFSVDTGTSVGEIMGQTKSLNAVDMRPQRPFRIATASEDNSVAFFHGPPFKFQFTIKDHTRFVNALRYSPDGEMFVSGSADGAAFVYDGKSGEKLFQLGDPAHKGGIYAVCFSPNSKQILTVSADKTAKIWDVPSGELFMEFVMGSGLEDMQVGCLWQGEHILTVSLSGFINYLDLADPSKPKRILKGHFKPMTAVTVTEDKKTVLTVGCDSQICCWDVETSESEMVSGSGHTNQVDDVVVVDGEAVSCGMDDFVIFTSLADRQYRAKLKMPSQPKGLGAAAGGPIAVACINHIVLLRDAEVVFSQAVQFEPACAAVSHDGQQVAFGALKDNLVHVFAVEGSLLREETTLTHTGCVNAVTYSPDGAMFAACDAARKVVVYSLPAYEALVTSEWCLHTARVNCLAWSPDSQHLASGSLDTAIIIWAPYAKSKKIVIKAAHPVSQVTGVAWLDDVTLVSVGQDSCLRKWRITHH